MEKGLEYYPECNYWKEALFMLHWIKLLNVEKANEYSEYIKSIAVFLMRTSILEWQESYKEYLKTLSRYDIKFDKELQQEMVCLPDMYDKKYYNKCLKKCIIILLFIIKCILIKNFGYRLKMSYWLKIIMVKEI